jgi:Trk K+ transport system NAD-binding subunit
VLVPTKSSFVLCGLGRTGARVLYYLREAGLPVVVVDNRCRPDDPRLHGARLVSGDCRDREMLHAAGVVGARGVLVMTDDDLVNVSTVLQVRGLDEQVRIVVRLFDQNLLARLAQTVTNVYALSTAMLTAPVLAGTATTGAVLGTFCLEGHPDDRRLVVESLVRADGKLGGRTIAEVVEPQGAVAVAHLPEGHSARILHEVDAQARLKPGDRLILCGERRAVAPVVSDPASTADHDLRWAGWVRRNLRVVRRTLEDMEPAVLICSAVLVVVLVASTLVLTLGVTRYRVPDAFLRTVSIMATGASLHEEEYNDLPYIRVFVSVLRILGAVLMAAFTAIVTNYLLRARLGGILEVRRIPEGGHVVVCGLGSIGFQTVKELIGSGERVVVIESDSTNPFVQAARRLGAAVIVGDATLPEAQAHARLATAVSVVVATSNDVSNLSIALLAREKQPAQRVVVLMTDPQMAEMLRRAARVEFAVSVPLLAAPAFLAALFGDRVLTVVMVGRHLVAVFEMVVHDGGPLAGQSMEKAAAAYRFCPIALIPASGEKKATGELAAGDRLVGVIRVADLDGLMRRQQPKEA